MGNWAKLVREEQEQEQEQGESPQGWPKAWRGHAVGSVAGPEDGTSPAHVARALPCQARSLAIRARGLP